MGKCEDCQRYQFNPELYVGREVCAIPTNKVDHHGKPYFTKWTPFVKNHNLKCRDYTPLYSVQVAEVSRAVLSTWSWLDFILPWRFMRKVKEANHGQM